MNRTKRGRKLKMTKTQKGNVLYKCGARSLTSSKGGKKQKISLKKKSFKENEEPSKEGAANNKTSAINEVHRVVQILKLIEIEIELRWTEHVVR